MPATYDALATTTLGSGTSSVTFNSINGTYTDLVLIISGGNTSGGVNLRLQFNSDTNSNYSDTRFFGDGTSVSTDRQSNQVSMPIGISMNLQTNHIINIQNYSNTTTFKTVVARSNSGASGGYIDTYTGVWRSTSAISSILITPSGANFATGTMLTLYGIKAA